MENVLKALLVAQWIWKHQQSKENPPCVLQDEPPVDKYGHLWKRINDCGYETDLICVLCETTVRNIPVSTRIETLGDIDPQQVYRILGVD